jgi:hypothetical protein
MDMLNRLERPCEGPTMVDTLRTSWFRRRRVLVFGALAAHHVWLARLLVTLRIEVVYIFLVGSLNTVARRAELAAVGIRQVNYPALSEYDAFSHEKILARVSTDVFDAVFPPKLLNRIVELFPLVADRPNKVQALLYDVIATAFRPHAPAYALAQYYRENGCQSVLWSPGNLLAALLKRYFRLPSVLNAPGVFAGMLISLVRKVAFSSAPSVKHADQGAAPMDAAVLFFPHKGPMYGQLFAKDHYYTADSSSSLSRSRICHVEVASTLGPLEAPEVLERYRDHGIVPYLLQVQPLSRSPRRWLASFKSGARMGLGPIGAFLVALGLLRIEQGIAALASFKNARLALLGYEYLFPVWLAYALQVRNVRVVATQERLMHSMFPNWTVILDDYFVYGEASRCALRKNRFAVIGKIHVVGDHRAAWLSRKPLPDVGFPAGYEHATLVLDWHSAPTADEDARITTACYENNKLFYRNIIALARLFPRNCFVIRGKNAEWLKLKAFSEIHDGMAATPNIVINSDYSEPLIAYSLAAAANSVVARYTSLGDQCLAISKPVIYHECSANNGPLVRSILDFVPYPVMVTTFEALVAHYSRIVSEGSYLSPEDTNHLANFFFSGKDAVAQAQAKILATLERYLEHPGDDFFNNRTEQKLVASRPLV